MTGTEAIEMEIGGTEAIRGIEVIEGVTGTEIGIEIETEGIGEIEEIEEVTGTEIEAVGIERGQEAEVEEILREPIGTKGTLVEIMTEQIEEQTEEQIEGRSLRYMLLQRRSTGSRI